MAQESWIGARVLRVCVDGKARPGVKSSSSALVSDSDRGSGSCGFALATRRHVAAVDFVDVWVKSGRFKDSLTNFASIDSDSLITTIDPMGQNESSYALPFLRHRISASFPPPSSPLTVDSFEAKKDDDGNDRVNFSVKTRSGRVISFALRYAPCSMHIEEMTVQGMSFNGQDAGDGDSSSGAFAAMHDAVSRMIGAIVGGSNDEAEYDGNVDDIPEGLDDDTDNYDYPLQPDLDHAWTDEISWDLAMRDDLDDVFEAYEEENPYEHEYYEYDEGFAMPHTHIVEQEGALNDEYYDEVGMPGMYTHGDYDDEAELQDEDVAENTDESATGIEKADELSKPQELRKTSVDLGDNDFWDEVWDHLGEDDYYGSEWPVNDGFNDLAAAQNEQ